MKKTINTMVGLVEVETLSCMNCKHKDTGYCPFHGSFTGWDDVYCNKWEEFDISAETTKTEEKE